MTRIEEIRKVYATRYKDSLESKYWNPNEADIWTISMENNKEGWETDSGCDGYGLPKTLAEYYVKCINEYPLLLSQLDIAVKALEQIAYYDDGIIRQYEEVGEFTDIFDRISKEALEKLRG